MQLVLQVRVFALQVFGIVFEIGNGLDRSGSSGQQESQDDDLKTGGDTACERQDTEEPADRHRDCDKAADKGILFGRRNDDSQEHPVEGDAQGVDGGLGKNISHQDPQDGPS